MGFGGIGDGVGIPPVTGLRVWHASAPRQSSFFFFIRRSGRTELRREESYVPLADAKILKYFVLFPMGFTPK